MRDDILARRMFYGGCALLPWLWFVNVLYFRKQVYGPLPFFDDPTDDDDNNQLSSPSSPSTGGGFVTSGMPDITTIVDDDDGNNGDNDRSDDDGTSMEQTSLLNKDSNPEERDAQEPLTDEEMAAEVRKWVGRSARGSLVGFSLFVAWTVAFQLTRESWDSSWMMMMPEDEEDRTGW